MPNLTLSVLSGIAVFLAFEKFNLVPTILFFPYLFNRLLELPLTKKQAFGWGFLTSFIIMLGGFYWIVYVIHEFGYLPWSVSVLLYLCFCGFGALNFPLFLTLASTLYQKLNPSSPTKYGLWVSLFLPALFTLIEFLLPKLFPWSIGHCLYRQRWLIQVVELTGGTFLTFLLYSLAGTVAASFVEKRAPKRFCLIPLSLLLFSVAFSFFRLNYFQVTGRTLRVALIQANIGSLEKVAAQTGVAEKVEYVVAQHEKLTDKALAHSPKPDLILWPETALPFQLDGVTKYARRVKDGVLRWNVPLIAGGYSQSPTRNWRDYNTAFLLEPQGPGTLRMDRYFKMILLAFGEYLPLGDLYPKLYRWFPQIGGFERGTSYAPFVLKDGTRLGVNICYESILPSFFRKTVQEGVNAVINLTNDSWFGPTSEPYLHGSLTVFRAVETRVPLFRVTNTGTSFSVDSLGKISEMTPVYEEALLRSDLVLPQEPPRTFYLRWGDWFIAVAILILAILTFRFKRQES